MVSRGESLIEQYKAIHSRCCDYGTSSERLFYLISPYVLDLNTENVLDYGCGRSKLVDRLKETGHCLRAFRYDPAVPEFSVIPNVKIDLILNTDVLEHIPEEALDSVLMRIKSICQNVFFKIALLPSVTLLPNGKNAHCTLRSMDWWHQKLLKHFSYVEEIPSLNKRSAHFVIWRPTWKTRLRHLFSFFDRWKQ